MRPGFALAALVAGLLVLAQPSAARMLRQVGSAGGGSGGTYRGGGGYGLAPGGGGRLPPGTGVAGLQGYGGDRGGFGYDNSLSYGAGQVREAVITSDVGATTSVGAIEGDTDQFSGAQAAAYARGMSRATGLQALGLQVAQEKDAGKATAAADAIRKNAGYQGTSFAGDIFGSDNFDDSTAGRAIRRTQADNAQLQARTGQRAGRYGSTSPFDI